MNSTATLAAAVSAHSLPEAPLKDKGPHTGAVRKKAREKQRLREVREIMNPGATQFMVLCDFQRIKSNIFEHFGVS